MIIVSLLLIFAAVVLLVAGVANHADPALIGSIVATLLAVVVLIGSARRAASVRLAAAADGTGAAPTVHSGRPVGMVIDGAVVERPAMHAPGSTPPPRQAPPPATDPFQPSRTAAEAPPGGIILMDEADEDDGPATVPAQPTSAVELVLAEEDLDADLGIDLDEPAIDLGLASADRSDPGDLVEFDDEDPPGEPAVQLVSPADQALIARMETNVLVVDGRPRYHLARCPHLTGRATEALPVREAVELGFSPCARCEPATALSAGARPN